MDIGRIIEQNRMLNTPAAPVMDTSGLSGKVEGAFRALNLNTPLMRSVVTAGIASGVLHVLKPSLMFDETGAPKVWDALADPSTNQYPTTPFPWYIAAGAVGFAAGLFI